MACSTYIHNDPTGGSKYVSGTTCTGAVVNYTLTFGQSVCMDDYLPLTLENGLTNLGDCTGVTPTPTPTPQSFCFYSGKTFTSVDYYCGFNGVTYQNVYGSLTFTFDSPNHPTYSFVVTNGVDSVTVTVPNGQTFIEYTYPQVIYTTGNDGQCSMQNFTDWNISYAPIIECSSILTPTPTPTKTATPSVTPTKTPNPLCPEQLLISDVATLTELDGTYNRIHSYTGGTFDYGYINYDGSNYYLVSGSLSGSNYPVFVSTNTTAPFNPVTLGYTTFTNTWNIFDGDLSTGVSPTDLGCPFTSTTISSGGIKYPTAGQKYDFYAPGVNILYLSYSTSCPTPTPTVTNTNTPTQTKTPTPTPTTPPLSFNITSGATKDDACFGGRTGIIYAVNLGNCGGCLPLTCFPCLNTSQRVYKDASLTTIVDDGYYTNNMDGAGNYGTWYIVGGYPQGGGFSGGC